MEGERKQVTVLFADLKSSMELLADRDPEEARKVLDPVLERMMEAVHRYEGTVNQTMGDGIMALFGAPIAHEDHAVRACYAALRMQEAVKRHAEGVRQAEGVVVEIRVGLNSGEVLVRSIGSDLRVDYTAVGQTTHLAARMEQMATPGTIAVTADTLALADGYVEVAPLGSVPVRGLPGTVNVYELTAAAPVRSRFHAAASHGLTSFVGRANELADLRRALGRAKHGRGSVIAVIGEPGVGKSRCCWEFVQETQRHGWRLLHTGAVSYGQTTPYLPVVDLVRQYFEVDQRDDAARVETKVSQRLATLDPRLETLRPALLSLLDVPLVDADWDRLEPAERRRRIFHAVNRLLLRHAEDQPLLVLVEDLHWIDSETHAVLDSLVESIAAARVLLVVNYRPEYQHTWHARSHYTEVHLGPLTSELSAEFLDELLGSDERLLPLKRSLIARTGGNPLFLEQSVRTLAESRALAGELGAYSLARPVGAVQIPATVENVIAARIDRLAPQDKRLLQSASVIGAVVPMTLLQFVVEDSDAELRESLRRLVSAEFLHETALFPDLEYTFRHALIEEVAYRALLAEKRRALHVRIVDRIEELYADRLAEHADRLAYHSARGGIWRKAVSYNRQAGAKAARRSAYREAIAALERAIEALGHLPEDRAVLEEAVDVRFALRGCLYALGEFDRILDCLREAERLANALGDRQRLGWTSTYLSAHFWNVGDHRRAVELAERAVALGPSDQSFTLQLAESNLDLAIAHHARGEYGRTIDILIANLRALEGPAFYRRYRMASFYTVVSRTILAWTLAQLGDFDQALATAQAGVIAADESKHPYSAANANFGAGCVYAAQGKFADATACLTLAVDVCRRAEIPALFPFPASLLGYAHALSGASADALPLAQEAVDKAAAIRLNCHQALREAHLAEAYLLAGHRELAHDHARQAWDLSRVHEERANEASCLRVLGQLCATDDPPDRKAAEGYYRAALALASDIRMRPLLAHCYLGLGKLYLGTDRREEAQKQLAIARTMYRDMGMTYWLREAEAQKLQ